MWDRGITVHYLSFFQIYTSNCHFFPSIHLAAISSSGYIISISVSRYICFILWVYIIYLSNMVSLYLSSYFIVWSQVYILYILLSKYLSIYLSKLHSISSSGYLLSILYLSIYLSRYRHIVTSCRYIVSSIFLSR